MSNFNNPMTDMLKLVHIETIHKGWFSPAPNLNAGEGFLLEHYRGNVHIGSYSSQQLSPARQKLDVKDGDIVIRLNLGPRTQLIQGTMRTWDQYIRPYRLPVDLQIHKPAQFLMLYRQENDPVALAVRAIQEALQQYAARTVYEEIRPLNLVAVAQAAFDREPERCKAGLRILEVHDPELEMDQNYKPIKLRQLLPLKSSLTTLDGYVRPYEVQIELEIVNIYDYKSHDLTGEKALSLAEATIHGELQRHAHEQFYEELTALDLHTRIEKEVFAAFPRQVRAGLRIVRANKFSLGTDPNYVPVSKIQTLTVTGTLKTLEGYERAYRSKVELQVANLHIYLQRLREKTHPMGLAQATIEGEILRYAARQTYEALNDESLLFDCAQQAFATLKTGETGGLSIKQVHFFTLQPSPAYFKGRILEISDVIKTLDKRACPYVMTVEVKLGDAARVLNGVDPLEVATAAIKGAVIDLTHDKNHDEVLQLDLVRAAHEVFEKAPDSMIGGLLIVKAHKVQISVDANIQASADIEHARDVGLSEVRARGTLMKASQDEEYDLKVLAEKRNLELVDLQGQTTYRQLLFGVREEQVRAMSHVQTDFLEKAISIEIENLESGSSHEDVLKNIQRLIGSTQVNFPQLAGPSTANEPAQSRNEPARPAGEEDVVDAAAQPKTASIYWPEAGLAFLEVPFPPTVLPYMRGRTHAFQIQKVEKDRPAHQAGVPRGSFLLDIDERDIYASADFEAVYSSLASKKEVEITVTRTGAQEPFTLKFTTT